MVVDGGWSGLSLKLVKGHSKEIKIPGQHSYLDQPLLLVKNNACKNKKYI